MASPSPDEAAGPDSAPREAAVSKAAGRPRSRWSFRIGRLFGISIFVHLTLVALLAWIAMIHYVQGNGIEAAAAGLATMVALFTTIVFHELAHALTARRFGVETRDITLLPIGGVSNLEHMPESPGQEALVAIAGPAFNVAMAGLIAAAIAVSGGTFSAEGVDVIHGSFLPKLFWMNVSLAIFNLVPAFPMDGGRLLRSLLASRMDRVDATLVAARIGQAFAVVFGFAGLFFNPLLVLIAVFVWFAGTQELAATQMKSALHGVPVRKATITDLQVLHPGEPLSHAVDLMLGSYQQDFPVLDDGDGSTIGVLTRSDLVKGLAEGGPQEPVERAMHRDFEVANAGDPLDTVLERLDEEARGPIVVREQGRMLGLLTRQNVAELLMTRQALRGLRRAG
jgi:Zn-dependent protease/CBS domain-containing protein